MTELIAVARPVPTQKSQNDFSARLQIVLAKAARAALPCNVHLHAHIPVLAPAERQQAEFQADKPIFDCAKTAVRFAVTRDGSPSRPFYSTFLDKSTMIGRNSSGFSVLDAAAQAGIILAVLVRNLGPASTSSLVAASAPQTIPCTCGRECCSRHRVFRPWRYAIDYLTIAAIGHCDAGVELRRDLLVKIYGSGRIAEIAERLSLDEDLVNQEHRALLRWLRGAKGKRGEESTEGLERMAWRDAESVLRDHRIVG